MSHTWTLVLRVGRVHLKLLTYEIRCKLSKFASYQLKLKYLVCSKIFHMQLIKDLASEHLYLQMKNMLLNHI